LDLDRSMLIAFHWCRSNKKSIFCQTSNDNFTSTKLRRIQHFDAYCRRKSKTFNRKVHVLVQTLTKVFSQCHANPHAASWSEKVALFSN